MIDDLNEIYNKSHSCITNQINLPYHNAFNYDQSDFDDIIEQVVQKVYSNPQTVLFDDLLTLESARVIWDEVRKILNLDFERIETDVDVQLANNLRRNIFVFSHAKTYQELQIINSHLTDENGSRVLFNEFKKQVKQVNELFNKNYLRTEYNYATATANEIKKWNDFTGDNPEQLLIYKAVQDKRTRTSHKALNNITLPASHSFWDTYSPVNGWNCRCTLVRAKNSTKITDIDRRDLSKLEIDNQFKFNAAKQSQIFFIEKHPYYSRLSDDEQELIRRDSERLYNEN